MELVSVHVFLPSKGVELVFLPSKNGLTPIPLSALHLETTQ
jgi:hypothetical protein